MEALKRIVQPGHEPGAYIDLMQSFLRRGYDFIFFHELDPKVQGQLILRHDIDFDTNAALQMAEMEAMLGVRSTYFFLLCSRSYNLLHPTDAANVRAIRDMGHEISLHFDSTLYTDIQEGLKHEAEIFRSCFGREVRITSFHRPDTEMIRKHPGAIQGIEHTYQSKYFRDMKYMSDSTGVWRFGHPCDTTEFTQKRNAQLLIHPIWWTFEGADNVEKLDAYFSEQVADLRNEIAKNCIPYRKTLTSIEAAQDRRVRMQSHNLVIAKGLEAAKRDRAADHYRSAAGS